MNEGDSALYRNDFHNRKVCMESSFREDPENYHIPFASLSAYKPSDPLVRSISAIM